MLGGGGGYKTYHLSAAATEKVFKLYAPLTLKAARES